MEAAQVLEMARERRGISRNALATLSGVPASTVTRIESGETEPAWDTMTRLLAAVGLRLDINIQETGSDDPFMFFIERIPTIGGPDALRNQLLTAAELAPVTRRRGVRWIALQDKPSGELAEILEILNSQNQAPVVSSTEAFRESVERDSFFPLIYVDRPAEVTGLPPAKPLGSCLGLLETTDNVRKVTRIVDGVAMVSREWGLLDSQASPMRQPDASMYLVDRWLKESR